MKSFLNVIFNVLTRKNMIVKLSHHSLPSCENATAVAMDMGPFCVCLGNWEKGERSRIMQWERFFKSTTLVPPLERL
jgi:hypothetical protein